MIKTGYNPIRLKIYDHERPPAAPPVSFNLSGHEMWQSSATQDSDAPGSRGDVRQFRLDNWKGSPEEAMLRESDGKLPALIPGWHANALDNSASDWESLRSSEEIAFWTAALEAIASQIHAINTNPQPSADDLTRLAELLDEQSGLQTNGFLETIPGAQLWGSDATGIYRRLSSANVPFHYRLKRYPAGIGDNGNVTYSPTLEQRPFTLWFYRSKPRPEQVNHYVQIEIGRRLRLVIEGADRALLYRKNESRPAKDWADADQEREELLALRFLSPEQAAQITTERNAISALEQAAREAKRQLTADEMAAIKDHQEIIKKVQADVGLRDDEKARLKELDLYLFRQIDTVELVGTGQSLLGTPFSITFLDSGVGFVQLSLDIGANTYVFEDRYTTSRRLVNRLWGNPTDRKNKFYNSDERLEIKGSGGALAFRFGYVAVNTLDIFRSSAVWLGTEVDTEELIPVFGTWLAPDDTRVDFGFDPIEDRPGYFQLSITFRTDGKRLPVLFRAVLQLPALPSPEPSLILDTLLTPGLVVSGTVHMDEERKGPIWQTTLHAFSDIAGGINALGLPSNLRRRSVDVLVRDAGGNWLPVLTGGVIVDDTLVDARAVSAPGGSHLGADAFDWAQVRLTIRDRAQKISESLIFEDIELDGLWLGDAIYQLRRNMGAPEAQLAMLPRGEHSGWQLPQAAPGSKAVLKPSVRTERLSYITNDLVGRYGFGRQYYIDALGRDRLEMPADRIRFNDSDPIVYRLAEAAASGVLDDRRFYHAGEDGFQRGRSLDKFKSSVEVYGAVNPDTKQRFAFKYELKQATDASNVDDPRYVGTAMPLDPVTDDAWTDATQVEAVGRTLIARYCRVPDTWEVRTPYSPDLLPGEVFLFADAHGVTSPWRIRSAVATDDLTNDELVLELESV